MRVKIMYTVEKLPLMSKISPLYAKNRITMSKVSKKKKKVIDISEKQKKEGYLAARKKIQLD